MISRTVKDLRPFDGEYVMDIETVSATGDIIAIGVASMFDNDDDVYICDNWDDLLQHICCGRGQEFKRIRIWAHNGFGFDHLFLMSYMAGFGELDVKNGVFDHGHIQYIEIAIFGITVVLADSFAIFQMSLARTCDGFCNIYKKIEIGVLPELLDRVELLNYLRHDVLALREALQEILTTLQTIFPSFGNVLPATVGSLAMRIFRMSLKKDLVTSPRVLDQFEREGYFGGLVGCIQKGLYSGVWGIDVNSMYPSVMVGQLYPYSYFGYWTYDWESDGVGLWKCRIKYPPGYSGVKWLYDISRMLIVDEGVCVIDTETVEYLMANNYHVQVIMGYRYLDLSDDMFQYMDSLYALKKEGGTKKTTVKYILNSTYGKFGQKHERTKISTLKDANELIQLINRGISVHEYDFGKQQIYTWTDRELSTNTFCIIAALVTARARLKLVKAMSSLTSIGYRVLYYDTDSIHFIPIGGFDLEACEREGVFIHPNDLGSWGIQFENAEAGYAGRKLYYYTEGEKKGKVVAKGVSGFTQMDMKRLILDGEKEGSYLSCTSPRKVLFQNVNPGVFSKYTRMVRVLNEKEVK